MANLNICYALDEIYIEQALVSIASILKNSNYDDKFNFYIMENCLNEQQRNLFEELKSIKEFNIEFININIEDFISCPILKDIKPEYSNYHVTMPTYFRFHAPKYFANLDKILYLDCDVIVRTSLEELFNINIENYAAMMAEDASNNIEKDRLNLQNYFNAGVMMINLDYWRKNNITNKLFEYCITNKENILWQDQDIINSVLNENILKIKHEWNYQYFQYEYSRPEEMRTCKILHFAGRFKPWLIPFECSIYDIYYYYLSMTPLKNNIIEYKLRSSNKSLKDNIGGNKTNILVKAHDEDIQGVYKEITKLYHEIGKAYKDIEWLLNNKIDASIAYLIKYLDEKAESLLRK